MPGNTSAGTQPQPDLAAILASIQQALQTLIERIIALKRYSHSYSRLPSYIPPNKIQLLLGAILGVKEKDTVVAVNIRSFIKTNKLNRQRIEEVGHFDGTGNVYIFIDRFESVVIIKSLKLIFNNIVTCFLKDNDSGLNKVYNWWIFELSKDSRKKIVYYGNLIPLYNILTKRFGISEN